MTTDTLLLTLKVLVPFWVLIAIFLALNVLVVFCHAMAELEKQKAEKSRKGIFNEKKGDG